MSDEEIPVRHTGWGPFPLRGEAQRLADAKAEADRTMQAVERTQSTVRTPPPTSLAHTRARADAQETP